MTFPSGFWIFSKFGLTSTSRSFKNWGKSLQLWTLESVTSYPLCFMTEMEMASFALEMSSQSSRNSWIHLSRRISSPSDTLPSKMRGERKKWTRSSKWSTSLSRTNCWPWKTMRFASKKWRSLSLRPPTRKIRAFQKLSQCYSIAKSNNASRQDSFDS